MYEMIREWYLTGTWARRGKPTQPSIGGVHGMLVYLFRDENSLDTLAYSTDVTGRNIPRRSPKTQWSFVSAAQIQGDDYEEVRLRLRRWGFYVFRR
jgi:hypothetical protein